MSKLHCTKKSKFYLALGAIIFQDAANQPLGDTDDCISDGQRGY